MGYQQHYPTSPDYRKTTVKVTFYQFSFPNDSTSQNTIRKRYIQNEQERSLIYTVSISQSPIEADNFLSFRPSFASYKKKKKLLDNSYTTCRVIIFPRKQKEKNLPIKALNCCGSLSEPALMTTNLFLKLLKGHIKR